MIQIIDMTAEHLEAVHEIDKSAFKNPWSLKDLSKEINENKHAIYKVAVTETGLVAGYAGLWHIINEGHITNIAVAAPYRRKGIADKLVEAIIASANKLEMIGLTLEVRVSNAAAISLYKKHGFKEEGIRKRYYSDNGEDAIIMWKYF